MRKLFLLLALLCCAAANAKPDEAAIMSHQAARLTVGLEKGGEKRVLLEAGGRSLALTLKANDALLAQVDTITRGKAAGAGNEFLAGAIDGVPGSWARLSKVAGRWTGAVYDGKELLLVDPVDAVRGKLKSPVAAGTDLVAYKLSDVYMVDRVDGIVAPLRYEALVAPEAVSVATKQLELGVVTDADFAAVHGGNASAVVASRINTIDGIYSNQVGVQVVASSIRPLSSNGTLTSTNSSTLLEAFRVMVAGGQVPRGDLTHLMSGKDFDGSTVGVAYIGVICNASYGVGVNQVRDASQTTALTMAHEMGHNFGAPHDGEGACVGASAGIMSPILNGSSTFSTCSLSQMADDVTAASCLGPVGTGGGVVIFANGLE